MYLKIKNNVDYEYIEEILDEYLLERDDDDEYTG